jgi:hypothetical protein
VVTGGGCGWHSARLASPPTGRAVVASIGAVASVVEHDRGVCVEKLHDERDRPTKTVLVRLCVMESVRDGRKETKRVSLWPCAGTRTQGLKAT